MAAKTPLKSVMGIVTRFEDGDTIATSFLPPGASGGDMLAANNLSDVANVATSRTNLGLNTTANQTDSVDKRFATDTEKTTWNGKAAGDHNHTGVYAPVLGADDNYATDAEKVKLSNLSGTNTGDQDLSGKLNTSAFAGLAKITVGTVQPVTPSVGDLWIDTN